MHVFQVLGPLHVIDAHITASRQRIVLAMLLLEANKVVPVGRLVDAVWQDTPPATAKSQIQICISTIRRALNHAGLDNRIVTSPAGYQIGVADGELDLRTFNDLLGEGRDRRSQAPAGGRRHRVPAGPGALPGRAIERCGQSLVRGGGGPARRTTAGRRRRVSRVELHLGRHRELIDELTALVTEHPLRERLWHQLITALYRSGRQADALAAYRRRGKRRLTTSAWSRASRYGRWNARF